MQSSNRVDFEVQFAFKQMAISFSFEELCSFKSVSPIFEVKINAQSLETFTGYPVNKVDIEFYDIKKDSNKRVV